MTTKSMTNYRMKHGEERSKGHTIVGVALSAFGIFWLAKKVGWIPVAAGSSNVFWPAVIIVVGIAMILSARRRYINRGKDDSPATDSNSIN